MKGDRLSTFLIWRQEFDKAVYLAVILFAVYVDEIANKIKTHVLGCHMTFICTGIFLYADDICFTASSIHILQLMLNVRETKLSWLDVRITVKKSACMRFRRRFYIQCVNLITNLFIYFIYLFGTLTIKDR